MMSTDTPPPTDENKNGTAAYQAVVDAYTFALQNSPDEKMRHQLIREILAGARKLVSLAHDYL